MVVLKRELKIEETKEGGLRVVLSYGKSGRFIELTHEEELKLLKLLKEKHDGTITNVCSNR